MERVDANGKIWVKAYAHSSLTAKAPYGCYISYNGYRTGSLASVDTEASDSVHFHMPRWKIGVGRTAASTGDLVWMQVGGVASFTIGTATSLALGEFVEISGDSIVLGVAMSSFPDYATNAVCYTASSSTSVELLLLNKLVIGRE